MVDEVTTEEKKVDGRKTRKRSGPTRKRLRHPSVIKRYRERSKALWKNNREKMLNGPRAAAAKGGRVGVPDGMRKAEALVAWKRAEERAEELFTQMIDNGIVKDVSTDDFEEVTVEVPVGTEGETTEITVKVPKTDAGMAATALKRVMVEALSPLSNQAGRLAALRTVLEYTKQKPASKQDLTVNKAEDWLAMVAADASKDDKQD